MRGGVAPMDKFIKTSLVLKYGVDLVVELPTVYAIQSADIFALAAVSILNELHCTDIYFGSESDDINVHYVMGCILRLFQQFSLFITNNIIS